MSQEQKASNTTRPNVPMGKQSFMLMGIAILPATAPGDRKALIDLLTRVIRRLQDEQQHQHKQAE